MELLQRFKLKVYNFRTRSNLGQNNLATRISDKLDVAIEKIKILTRAFIIKFKMITISFCKHTTPFK